MSIENRIKRLETKSAESFTTEEIGAVVRLRELKSMTPEQKRARINELIAKARGENIAGKLALSI